MASIPQHSSAGGPRPPSLLLVLLLAAALFFACSPGAVPPQRDAERIIRIAGSDTMAPLVQRWSAAYMQSHPGISIYSEGGGSGRGIEALIAGRIELCAASRPLQASEVKRLLEARGSLGFSVLTARDALSIYLHPDNPVRDLSLAQLRGIFSGEIANWRELGGADLPVQVVHRQPNSGTYHFLRSHVLLEEPYGPAAHTVANTQAVVQTVAQTPGAIGYGGCAYGVGVVPHCSVEGIEPTPGNVRSGAYPISRYLYLYSARPLRGPIEAFVDWVLSDAGQGLVAEVGYIPLWEVE